MDDDHAFAIRSHYTRIGMLMEDAAPVALRLGGNSCLDRASAIVELRQAIAAIVAELITAGALEK